MLTFLKIRKPKKVKAMNYVNELLARLQKYNPHRNISTKDVAEALGYGNTQIWDATKTDNPNKRVNRAAELALALLDAKGSDALNSYMSKFDVEFTQDLKEHIGRKVDQALDKSTAGQIDLVDELSGSANELVTFVVSSFSDYESLNFLTDEMKMELAEKLIAVIESEEGEVLLLRLSKLASLIAELGESAGALLNVRKMRQFVANNPAPVDEPEMAENKSKNLSVSELPPKAHYGFESPLTRAMLKSDVDSKHIDESYDRLIDQLVSMFGDKAEFSFAEVKAALVALVSPDMVQPSSPEPELPDWIPESWDVSGVPKKKMDKILKMGSRNPLAAQQLLEVAISGK